MAYTTADFLTDLRLRVLAPGDTNVWDETDFLRLADAEIQTTILPLVMSLMADYYVTYTDQAIVANQPAYDIPARAVGMRLREVKIVTTNGALDDPPLIDLEALETTLPGTRKGFLVRMNQVWIYPTPASASGTLRQFFWLRPSRLIETTGAAQISAIDTGTGVVTVSSIPDTYTTGQRFDFVRADGASEPRAIDQTCSLVDGTDMSFASLPDGLAVGDYVTLAGETPIPQIPAELRPLLCAATAVRVCESMQLPGLDSARKTQEETEKKLGMLFTPRVVGAPKKIVAPRRWGI